MIKERLDLIHLSLSTHFHELILCLVVKSTSPDDERDQKQCEVIKKQLDERDRKQRKFIKRHGGS